MARRVALITGSNSGFGRLTTLELARARYYIIATVRSMERAADLLAEAKQCGFIEQIEIVELDVTQPETIAQAVERVRAIGRLDILVNNAGFAMSGFVEEVSVDEYKKQFDTNFFGLIAVTQQLLPLMREQKSGKIINISSISGLIGFPGLSPYVASKHAVEGLTESLRIELKPFNIDVALVEPGSYQTNIWTTGRVDAKRSSHSDSPYSFQREKLESYVTKEMPHYGDPTDVAKLIVHIAESKKSKLRYKAGKGTKATYIIKKLLPWRVWEQLILKQLGINRNDG